MKNRLCRFWSANPGFFVQWILVPVFLVAGAVGFQMTDGDRNVQAEPISSHVLSHPEAAPFKHPAPQDVDGEKIYQSRCMSCHQSNGQGVPSVFPPLDGTEWVTGPPGRVVRIVLHGMSGEVTVDGQTYNGSMPPWGTFLDNSEVAALVNYIRTSWGNDASTITPEAVAAVRKYTAEREQPWTAEELKKSANSGIPGQDGDSSGK